ncbi:ATP-binding protein [Demequina sp. NBRC 110051]|uniref:ATP-binding protein n=1 Tax=Demequina sp. NBRC 110051 TaxID=1570340 RepID=UPI00117E66DC|nr:ATP-binding protein [Demequina sp. NBRC 110051]
MGKVEPLRALRPELDLAARGFAPDTDIRTAASLIELVAQRASTEQHGPIRAPDVLAAFGAQPDDLRPAPSLFDDAPYSIREPYRALGDAIMNSSRPVLLTAEGGAGKSTFARAAPELLADRAEVVVYDCFGQGNYRRPDAPRHGHKEALVQITTELAGAGLCLPMIAAPHVAKADLLRAFVRRLEDARDELAQRGGRRLVVLVDAADNAEIAARENAELHSFAWDLLRLGDSLPPGVHLVLSCRPERLHLLDAPEDIVRCELDVFSLDETQRVVMGAFPDASDGEVAECHARTGGNPRVLAFAMEGTTSISTCLGRLAGITSGTEAPLDQLLQRRVSVTLRDAGAGRPALEELAELLTLLRPSIPLAILSELSGVPLTAIRSFVSDVGRGLVVAHHSVQFLDEPTETYFRDHHGATEATAASALHGLRTLSTSSGYAAASLPEVMWNAGHFDDLLQLATGHDALPSDNEVQRRQIEQLRVEFGLRAALALRRPARVVQLALRAGAMRAGSDRRLRVLLNNPDIAGAILDDRVLHELIASRELPSSWPGATLGSEAVMLAVKNERVASAASRVRLAAQSIESWARRQSDSRRDERISVAELAHVVHAIALTQGSVAAADYLSRWRPAHFVMQAAYRVASDLLMRGGEELVSPWFTATSHAGVALGAASAYQRLGLPLPRDVAERAWASVGRARFSLVSRDFNGREPEDIAMRGAAWLAAMAAFHGLDASAAICERLAGCYPEGAPFGLGDRHGTGRKGILFVIALRVALEGEELRISHFRPLESSEQRQRVKSNDEDLDRYLAPALPWLASWADMALARKLDRTGDLFRGHSSVWDSRERFSLVRRIARTVAAPLACASSDNDVSQAFEEFANADSRSAPEAAAIAMIAPLRGDSRFGEVALELADRARTSIDRGGDFADERASTLVEIARGLHAFSEEEELSYFQSAVEVASRAGDDSLPRLDTIIALAKVSKQPTHDLNLELARRASRVAETLAPLLYDGFDERAFTQAIDCLVGGDVLEVLSQWRDRRVGDLAWQLSGLTPHGASLNQNPLWAIVLAPFSERIDLSAALRWIGQQGPIERHVLAAANGVARRLGQRLDAEFTETCLGPPQVGSMSSPSAAREVGPSWSGRSERHEIEIRECRETLAGLDLMTTAGVSAAAEALHRAPVYDMALFISAMKDRSQFQWARIITRVSECDDFRPSEKAEFLNTVSSWESASRAFADALKTAVRTYIERHSHEILQGNWVGFNLARAGEVLESTESELHLIALDRLVLDEALRDAEHCYRLAAGVASGLDPSDAAFVLDAALMDFEEDLELEPLRSTTRQVSSVPECAPIANFVWCALADPRIEFRWRAAHAVRTALELGASDVIDALCEVATSGMSPGYADDRFPFYEMHAVEWLLIAVERFVRDRGNEFPQLMELADRMSRTHPDHIAIQMHCNRIQLWGANDSGSEPARAWPEPSEEPIDLEPWSRPATPKPFTHGAPESDFRVPSDLDEYMVGELTEAFEVSHQAVLDGLSTVILDDWEWRGVTALDSDPRREAGIYADGETYAFKSEVPDGDSLDYYLVRHASMTVAGRLLRTSRAYRDPETGRFGVHDWLASFDLARTDLRWVSDFRQPLPGDMVTLLPTEDREGWSREIGEVDLDRVFSPSEDWTCVDLDADSFGYDRSADALVSSALVQPVTSDALLRALGTGDGSFHLPRAGDETFELRSPPFVLTGWLDSDYVARGIDLHDRFAQHLTRELPYPASLVIDALSLEPDETGTSWVRQGDGEPVVCVETWSTMSAGSNPQGVCGSRLSIRNDVLDGLLKKLDVRLIAESRQRRRDRGRSRYRSNNYEEERSDGGEQFRVYTYAPGRGWRDLGGRTRTRSAAIE